MIFCEKSWRKTAGRQSFGKSLIDAYDRERKLEETERRVLYAMLLYPEKYWKLVNFYYNSRKSWMSAKNLEKLLRIRAQEEKRACFLRELRPLLCGAC